VWSAADIPDVPEGADPLDYINREKLREDNESLPKTKEELDRFFNDMPLTAEVLPDRSEMNREFMGIQSLVDETPLDSRMENFKDSGNEAYKLATRMKKEYKEGMDKREKEEKEWQDKLDAAKAAGKPLPKKSADEEKKEKDDFAHLNKLKESSRKRMLDAIGYYTQGLDVERDAMEQHAAQLKRHDPDDGPPPKPPHINKHLMAQLLSNRALVHLSMENYGRAQADADAALKYEPHNAKAAYRGAMAALSVNPPKVSKARQFLEAGRIHDEARKKIDWQFRAEQKSMDDIEKRIKTIEAVEAAKEAKAKAKLAAKHAESNAYQQSLSKALSSRGVKLGALVFDFANSPYLAQSAEGPGILPRPILDPPPPAPYSSSTRLHWPLLFLYPETLQSDFVPKWDEEQNLQSVLAQMFPPQADWAPWDEKKRYHLPNLSVWIDTRGPNIPADSTPAQDQAARMLINPNQSLRNILANPKLAKKGYAVPGIPTFIILPKQ